MHVCRSEESLDGSNLARIGGNTLWGHSVAKVLNLLPE